MSRAANIADEHRLEEHPTLLTEVLEYAMQFPTYQQLSLHHFSKHGTIRLARHYIDDNNSCPACLRRHPYRTQAARHLHNSKRCSAYGVYCDVLPADVVDALHRQEAVRMKNSIILVASTVVPIVPWKTYMERSGRVPTLLRVQT